MEIIKNKLILPLLLLPLILLLLTLLFLLQPERSSGNLHIDANEITARYAMPLRVGVDQALPPYAYVDNNGVIKGFLVDLVRSLALEYGLDVELYSRSRKDMLAGLSAGALDLVISNTADDQGYLSSNTLITSQDTFLSAMTILIFLL